MRLGLTFDLKPPGALPAPGEPDDRYEEYDPPETVEALARTLKELGHEVVRLGGGRPFLERILHEKVDFVFNIAEGQGTGRSREAQVPAVLEMLGIPYALSDPLTLSLSLDKALTKRLVALAGVSVPRDLLVRSPADLRGLGALPFPCLAKPAYEGSSKGVRDDSVLGGPEEAAARVPALLAAYRQPVLLEEFVEGDEYTVGVLGNDPPRAVGAMRIRPRQGPDPRFVYSIEAKRDWRRRVAYDVPPPLSPEEVHALYTSAVAAFGAIGCRDAARVDFRMRDGVPVFLEINPLPGLSPDYGDLPILARGHGIPYPELLRRILETAFRRCGLA
jgi:D-alanine-D-alanine ligase